MNWEAIAQPDSEIEESKDEAFTESMFKSALENPESYEDSDKMSVASSEIAVFDREDIYGDEFCGSGGSGPQWTWLTNGTCKVDPSQLPGPWFIENISSQMSLSSEAWRMNILQVILEKNGFYEFETLLEQAFFKR